MTGVRTRTCTVHETDSGWDTEQTSFVGLYPLTLKIRYESLNDFFEQIGIVLSKNLPNFHLISY